MLTLSNTDNGGTVVASSPSDRLNAYYAETADSYDSHESEPEHLRAFRLAIPFLAGLGVRRVLDVGCGTGKAMRAIDAAIPDAETVGVDPSNDLLAVAREKYGIAADRLHLGGGEDMPQFADESFDAAVAVAVLHHVPDPLAVVREMLRVSRRAIVISDSNRYGHGPRPMRSVKVGLRLVGLSQWADRRKYGEGRFYESDGDGVAFPFSALDLVPMLEKAGVEPFVVATKGTPFMHDAPIAAASHVLVIGLKP